MRLLLLCTWLHAAVSPDNVEDNPLSKRTASVATDQASYHPLDDVMSLGQPGNIYHKYLSDAELILVSLLKFMSPSLSETIESIKATTRITTTLGVASFLVDYSRPTLHPILEKYRKGSWSSRSFSLYAGDALEGRAVLAARSIAQLLHQSPFMIHATDTYRDGSYTDLFTPILQTSRVSLLDHRPALYRPQAPPHEVIYPVTHGFYMTSRNTMIDMQTGAEAILGSNLLVFPKMRCWWKCSVDGSCMSIFRVSTKYELRVVRGIGSPTFEGVGMAFSALRQKISFSFRVHGNLKFIHFTADAAKGEPGIVTISLEAEDDESLGFTGTAGVRTEDEEYMEKRLARGTSDGAIVVDADIPTDDKVLTGSKVRFELKRSASQPEMFVEEDVTDRVVRHATVKALRRVEADNNSTREQQRLIEIRDRLLDASTRDEGWSMLKDYMKVPFSAEQVEALYRKTF